MTNLGFGAMMHILGGGSKHSADEYYGQRIDAAEIKEERLRLKLSGGKVIEIWDDAQSCCESRYMTTDDDTATLIGGVLVRIEAKDGPNLPDEYGEHEQVFVEVGTDKGFITLVNHNEHNGYYGGFGQLVSNARCDAKIVNGGTTQSRSLILRKRGSA